MASPVHKYVLDTNFFIQGFREPAANDALQEFHRSFAPFEYLSAIEVALLGFREFVGGRI